MKALSILLLLGLAVAYCHAADRCSVYHTAIAAGAGANTAANIVCLAAHASNYDTSLHRSPTEYGLLQIGSRYWCNDTPGSNKACGIPCSSLLDSYIYDDIVCALRIIQDPNGFAAWDAWIQNCQGRDLSPYYC